MQIVDEEYDVIVIGSGIGGLTSAALLAKYAGKRVLVLEQHWTIGGQTHTFERKGGKYRWDVGVHYVGNLGYGGLPEKLFGAITEGRMKWRKLTNEYEHIQFGTQPPFRIGGSDPFAKLYVQFPDESDALTQYKKDLRLASNYFSKQFMAAHFARPLKPLLMMSVKNNKALAQLTTAKYMDLHFKSDELKAILTSHWMDYGVPPGESSFVIHALVTDSYLARGAFYPVGGSAVIAESIIPTIEAGGGHCISTAKVLAMQTKGKQLTELDVEFEHGTPKAYQQRLKVKQVISSIGIVETYRLLTPQPTERVKQLEEMVDGSSLLTVYLGLKDDPAKHGFDSCNYWFMEQSADELWRSYQQPQSFSTIAPQAGFLSFPSLKEGMVGTNEKRQHTAEIILPSYFTEFAQWDPSRWKKRGKEYRQYKEQIAQAAIELACKYQPALRPLIDYVEVSTPLSLAFFTGRVKGTQYSLPYTTTRETVLSTGPYTEYNNLFIAGTDAATLGVMGALTGGLSGAAACMGNYGLGKSLIGLIAKLQSENHKMIAS